MTSDMPRVAVVTGGGTGLGLAASQRLGQDGFQVVALELDREEDFPANIEFRRFDVTDERASEQLAEEFPEIDALVMLRVSFCTTTRNSARTGFAR